MGWVLTPSKLQLPLDKLCLGVFILQPKALPLWKKNMIIFWTGPQKVFLRFSFRIASQLGSGPALWVLTGHKCPSQQLCATTNSDLESNTSLAQAISISPCPPWRTEIKLTSIQSWFLLFLNNCITCWFAMLKFQQTMANSLMSSFFELRKQGSMWNLRTLPCYLLKGKIYANFPTIGRKLKATVCHECILNHLKSYFEVCLQHKKYINRRFSKFLKTIHTMSAALYTNPPILINYTQMFKPKSKESSLVSSIIISSILYHLSLLYSLLSHFIHQQILLLPPYYKPVSSLSSSICDMLIWQQ